MSKSVKIVYLIRHGQSVDNTLPVYQSTSTKLSNMGRKQAFKVAERFMVTDVDAIISSPLLRSKETAEILSKKLDKNLFVTELFSERIKPKIINGESSQDSKSVEIFNDWENSLYATTGRVYDGENYHDIISRADKALVFLDNLEARTSIVVSHGFFIRTILSRIIYENTLSPELFRKFQESLSMENTGDSVIILDDNKNKNWILCTYNDHSHLNNDKSVI